MKVPDIGDFKDVPIIEILVKPGETVKAEQPLMTLESDKASMEVPSPSDGVVGEIKVKVGDKVSQGSLILTLQTASGGAPAPAPTKQDVAAQATPAELAPATAKSVAPPPAPPAAGQARRFLPAFMPGLRCVVSRANSASISRA